jgi:AraC-like DNA-binding protein
MAAGRKRAPLTSETEIRHVEKYFLDVARPVVALKNDYVDRHVIPPHHHRRDQLLHGTSGVVMLATAQGTWVMPPERAMWIPAGVEHTVRMLGGVRMRSLYFEPGAIERMPRHCQVVGVTPFMRSLIAEAVELPAEYELGGRAEALMVLIQHEMWRLPHLPLSLPFPAHKALAKCCHAFLRRPDAHATIDAWSDTLDLSRRSFTRLFRSETGLSFMAWRQQACLVAALPRLAAGEAVTAIAIDLGYDNPAAFTAMFKRVLGASPRAYFREHG